MGVISKLEGNFAGTSTIEMQIRFSARPADNYFAGVIMNSIPDCGVFRAKS